MGVLEVYAVYVRYFAGREQLPGAVTAGVEVTLPARIPRHSLAARLFHWIMAAAMFMLLFTAFLPKVGIHFNWVTYCWIAGTTLTASIIFVAMEGNGRSTGHTPCRQNRCSPMIPSPRISLALG